MEDTLVDSFILNHICTPEFNIIYYIVMVYFPYIAESTW